MSLCKGLKSLCHASDHSGWFALVYSGLWLLLFVLIQHGWVL